MVGGKEAPQAPEGVPLPAGVGMRRRPEEAGPPPKEGDVTAPNGCSLLSRWGPILRRMAKVKTTHRCTGCGGESLQWQGRCPTCGEWNTLVEEVVERPVLAAVVAMRERAVAIGEVDDADGE